MCFNDRASFEVEIPEDKALIAFRAWAISGDEGELRSVWMQKGVEWSGDADEAPAIDNSHGIYAYATRKRVQEYVSANGGSVIGAVKCWGKITGHGTEGLRAEHARPVLFDETYANPSAMRWLTNDVDYYERAGNKEFAEGQRKKVETAKNAPKAAGQRYGQAVVASGKLEEAATDHGELYRAYAERKEAPARFLRSLSDEVARAKLVLNRLELLNRDRAAMTDPTLVPEVPTTEVNALIDALQKTRDELQETLNKA